MLINRQEPNTLKIVDLHVNNSLSEKLLGTTFDCKVKFNKRIKDICQKAKKHRRSCKTCKTCTIHGNNQKTYSY